MKKYSTIKAIQKIIEDNNLKFQKVSDPNDSLKHVHNCIRFYEGKKNVQWYGLESNAEWTLVQEPVSFMEAIDSKSMLKVEHEYIQENEEYRTLAEILKEMVDLGLNSAAIRNVISNGKWYIED